MNQARKNLVWIEQENAKRRKLGIKPIRAPELEYWRQGLAMAVAMAAVLLLLDWLFG